MSISVGNADSFRRYCSHLSSGNDGMYQVVKSWNVSGDNVGIMLEATR